MVDMQYAGNQPCVAVANSAARTQVSSLVAGTTAQQDSFVQHLTEV